MGKNGSIDWKWEWLRRNKEYREDFEKHGRFLQRGLRKHKGKVAWAIKNDQWIPLPEPFSPIYNTMKTKWQLFEGLRNPNDSSTENLWIGVFRPSNVTVAFTDRLYPELDFEGEESLTSNKCPHCLVIFVNVKPWFQKTKVMEEIKRTASKNVDALLKAQRSIYEKLSLRPRFDEFETYKKVYDLRHPKEGTGKDWKKIALEVFPDEPTDSAMRKVRYYNDQAEWWIQKGWQIL